MIAEKYQKIRFEAGLAQGRQQGQELGQQQGQQQERAQWVAWNRRRLDAEQRGEEFTEPPPTGDDTNGAHGG